MALVWHLDNVILKKALHGPDLSFLASLRVLWPDFIFMVEEHYYGNVWHRDGTVWESVGTGQAKQVPTPLGTSGRLRQGLCTTHNDFGSGSEGQWHNGTPGSMAQDWHITGSGWHFDGTDSLGHCSNMSQD